MAQWVNFVMLKQQVSIAGILGHYDMLHVMTGKGEELRGHCPFHQDAQPSFTANTQLNSFHCFGCHKHGNILRFVALKEGIDTGNDTQDDRHAALRIMEWFSIEHSRTERSPTPPAL